MEKTLDLKRAGVMELTRKELFNTIGGGLKAWLLGLMVGGMSESGWYMEKQIEAGGYIAFKNA